MGLDLNKLEHLIAVAEEGSITRAAARLHLSQQALSTSIRVLEREVGVPPAGARDHRHLPAARRHRPRRGRPRPARHGTLRPPARAPHRPRRERSPAPGPHSGRHRGGGHRPAAAGDCRPPRPGHRRQPALPGRTHRCSPGGRPRHRTVPGHAPAARAGPHHPGPPALNIAVAADHPFSTRPSVALAELADQHFIVWGPARPLRLHRPAHQPLPRSRLRTPHRTHPLQGTPPATAVIGTDRLAFVTTPPRPRRRRRRARPLALDPPPVRTPCTLCTLRAPPAPPKTPSWPLPLCNRTSAALHGPDNELVPDPGCGLQGLGAARGSRRCTPP